MICESVEEDKEGGWIGCGCAMGRDAGESENASGRESSAGWEMDGVGSCCWPMGVDVDMDVDIGKASSESAMAMTVGSGWMEQLCD